MKSLIGERIREARHNMGISQSVLADLCCKKREVISNIETGYINPSKETLDIVLDELNISKEDLYDNQMRVEVLQSLTEIFKDESISTEILVHIDITIKKILKRVEKAGIKNYFRLII